MITIFPYDGSAASVDSIMDVVGTKGVCNHVGSCTLPSFQHLGIGDEVHTDGKKWWVVYREKKSPTVTPKGCAK